MEELVAAQEQIRVKLFSVTVQAAYYDSYLG